jgi:hypothetical protein
MKSLAHLLEVLIEQNHGGRYPLLLTYRYTG